MNKTKNIRVGGTKSEKNAFSVLMNGRGRVGNEKRLVPLTIAAAPAYSCVPREEGGGAEKEAVEGLAGGA